MFINLEAGEIICLVASVCLSVFVFVDFDAPSQCSSQGAFKMVGRSKWLLFRHGCAIAVDHAFNNFVKWKIYVVKALKL